MTSTKVETKSFEEPLFHATVLSEKCDYSPNTEELESYAKSLGVDLSAEPELLEVVRQGLSAPLPEGWQVLQDENNEIFYYNAASGQSLWEHPQDHYYRKKVEQSRLSRHLRLFSKTPIPLSENSTPTRQPQARNMDVKHTSTPADLALNNGLQGSSIKNPDWTATPILGEKVSNNPQNNKENDPPLSSVSEVDGPTEYLELIPTASTDLYPKSLFSSNGTKSRSVLTQTLADDNDNHNETAANGDLDGTLRALQAKLKASLADFDCLSKDKSLLSCEPKVSDAPMSEENHERLALASPVNKIKSDLSLNSPVVIATERGLPVFTCPELGSSPTETSRSRNVDLADRSISLGQTPTTAHSTADGNGQRVNNIKMLNDFTTSAPVFSLNRSVLHRSGAAETSPVIHSSANQLVDQNFNEGLSHLVEERSRLQRKMLRIKLVYKTFKQRLASLDSSLRILQQHQSQPIGITLVKSAGDKHVDSPPQVSPENTPASAVPPSKSPNLVLPQTVEPEIITVRENTIPAEESPLRQSPQHDSVYVPSRPSFSGRASGSCTHSASVPYDLACSLASIDSHLHRVLYRLESSGDDSAVCDVCIQERNQCRRTPRQSQLCAMKPIESRLGRLSIGRTHRNIVADMRLLTPSSPNNRVFERPRLDFSPTWMQ